MSTETTEELLSRMEREHVQQGHLCVGCWDAGTDDYWLPCDVARVVAHARSLEAEADNYKNQAEYERNARITAANFPRNRNGYIPCERCGLDCGMDAIVADELWAAIAPFPDWPEAGVFCLWCMDELLATKGLKGIVRLYFPGKALLSESYATDSRAALGEAQ